VAQGGFGIRRGDDDQMADFRRAQRGAQLLIQLQQFARHRTERGQIVFPQRRCPDDQHRQQQQAHRTERQRQFRARAQQPIRPGADLDRDAAAPSPAVAAPATTSASVATAATMPAMVKTPN
jgi:hypothetical protein